MVTATTYRIYFRDKINVGLIRRIYHNLAKETTGNVYSSDTLSKAYGEKMLQLHTNELQRTLVQDKPLSFRKTKHIETFFRVFDRMCRTLLKDAITG